jgi:ATP-dependent DNA helicase RecG
VARAAEISLTTPLHEVRGITERQAEMMRALGVTNVGKLVAYLPMRHEKHEAESTIGELAPGHIISARGEITATRPVRSGRRPRFEAVLVDETGRLDLVWFNGLYMADRIKPGMRLRVQGKAQRRGPGLQVVNPTHEVLTETRVEPGLRDERVRAVYPATEDFSSRDIERVVAKVLPLALPLIEDHFPEAFRVARNLPTLADSYRMQHAPATLDESLQSRRRLAYDELLMLQLGVHMKRAHLRGTLKAPPLKHNTAIDAHIRARFPFVLTPGQEEVIAEIAKDLASPTPTNRLIQGDVGSGKTLVALYAMLMAVADRRQASLMAPTELLAEQHFASISRILAGSRESIIARLSSGEVDILVGTHALLTETVKFASLAVAIIDEQHRFGVHQRATLREKSSDASTTPHVLVMTATPIPRTLAITLLGDLDVSTIRGLPPGRRPITTRVAPSDSRGDVYDDLAARIDAGEQAYIVAPAIEPGAEEESLDGVRAGGPLRDVRTIAAELESGRLAGKRLAVLHGRLSRATREAVMERFRQGSIDCLVATTVIEVGVDVPNATVMVVEQADRFGLAQLHQLRGRVGRGSKDSICYLIADPVTPEGQQRLLVMETVNDGFVLAEKDLEIRGPGEVFGARQSGLPPFRVADLMRDRELLALARRDAAEWIARSPTLATPEEALIRRRLLKAYGAHLGLADVG